MTATGVKEAGATQAVRSRRVHYLSGFDPRGARFYHRLYREESAKQSRHNGSVLEVGERRRVTPQVSAWSVRAEWEGRQVSTEYEFMEWDDIVRQHWDASLPKLFRRGVPTYIKYAAGGGFNRIRKVSKGAFYTAIFPFVYLVSLAAILMVVALLGAWLSSLFFGKGLMSAGIALGITCGLGLVGLRLAERHNVFWVLRTCVFIVVWGTRSVPELDQRMAEMAAHIMRQQEAHPVDEVLIIGHSVGSILAVAVTARILEGARLGKVPAALHLLTLGQCIPYLSFIPSARAFRRDLEILANDERIPWTDATAPPDPLCFYQVDPIRVSGIATQFEERPKRVGVRILPMFRPDTYAKMRWNKVRVHFQYLMASERAADYDYFWITAGPGKGAAPGGVSVGERP